MSKADALDVFVTSVGTKVGVVSTGVTASSSDIRGVVIGALQAGHGVVDLASKGLQKTSPVWGKAIPGVGAGLGGLGLLNTYLTQEELDFSGWAGVVANGAAVGVGIGVAFSVAPAILIGGSVVAVGAGIVQIVTHDPKPTYPNQTSNETARLEDYPAPWEDYPNQTPNETNRLDQNPWSSYPDETPNETQRLDPDPWEDYPDQTDNETRRLESHPSPEEESPTANEPPPQQESLPEEQPTAETHPPTAVPLDASPARSELVMPSDPTIEEAITFWTHSAAGARHAVQFMTSMGSSPDVLAAIPPFARTLELLEEAITYATMLLHSPTRGPEELPLLNSWPETTKSLVAEEPSGTADASGTYMLVAGPDDGEQHQSSVWTSPPADNARDEADRSETTEEATASVASETYTLVAEPDNGEQLQSSVWTSPLGDATGDEADSSETTEEATASVLRPAPLYLHFVQPSQVWQAFKDGEFATVKAAYEYMEQTNHQLDAIRDQLESWQGVFDGGGDSMALQALQDELDVDLIIVIDFDGLLEGEVPSQAAYQSKIAEALGQMEGFFENSLSATEITVPTNQGPLPEWSQLYTSGRPMEANLSTWLPDVHNSLNTAATLPGAGAIPAMADLLNGLGLSTSLPNESSRPAIDGMLNGVLSSMGGSQNLTALLTQGYTELQQGLDSLAALTGGVSGNSLADLLANIADGRPSGLTDSSILSALNGVGLAANPVQFLNSTGPLAAQVNQFPIVAYQPFPQSFAQGVGFSFTLPEGAFTDPDAGDTLTYSARLADDTSLPEWLSFDGTIRTLSGTPPPGSDAQLAVCVTASDATGASASTTLSLQFEPDFNRPIESSSSAVLSDGYLNLMLTGQAEIDGTGNVENNHLTGNAAANTLDGLAGNDVLSGRGGNDTYLFGRGEGADTILAEVGTEPTQINTLQFKDGVITTDIILSRAGDALVFMIADSADSVTVNAFFDADASIHPVQRVRFADGSEWERPRMLEILADGGRVNRAPTVVQSLPDMAFSRTGHPYTIPQGLFTDPDGDTLVYSATQADGSALPGWLGFSAAQGILNVSSNTAYVPSVDVRITATDTAGAQASTAFTLHITPDAVMPTFSGTSTTLADGVRHLNLTGDTALDATGNSLGNQLVGNSGANVLRGLAGDDTLAGGAGADTLIGGLGSDNYYVGEAGDEVIELAGEGADQIYASISYTLPDHVEAMTVLGDNADLNATGNALNNKLMGNLGRNVLDGGVGADTMWGFSGNDTYVIDNAGDNIREMSNEGEMDVAQLWISFSFLANPANRQVCVERIEIMGQQALAATGNGRQNQIVGNDAANELRGGGGADVLQGGGGDDRLVIGTAERASLATSRYEGGSGQDTLALASDQSGVLLDFTAYGQTTFAGIERLDLTGGGNNTAKLTIDQLLHMPDAGEDRLIVLGNAGDAVQLVSGSGSWSSAGTQNWQGLDYSVYAHSGAAGRELYVQQGLAVI